jgi:hypothetical protein
MATSAASLASQSLDSPHRLPAPTGAYGVGRVTLVCTDPSRIEPLDPKLDVRKILVDVWYPTEPGAGEGAAAEYLDVASFERVIGADGLKGQFREAYDAIRQGVATHARTGALFAGSLRRAPVLIFSPGGGLIREIYASQLEDLASHGYVVAAITHSYDGFAAVFPDGSHIEYDEKRWPNIPSFEGVANLNKLEWHSADILVVLNELSRLNDVSSHLPFSGRLDLARVGAFGHSFGGVAAAHACQKDPRLKACLNQDGAMAMLPFYLDARGWGMDQAFMFIERPPSRGPISDADLAQLKLTRVRAEEVVARLNAGRDRVLQSTGTGSYRVLLQRSITTHMDFSDLPVLGAKDRAELEQKTAVVTAIRSYTRAFFDQYVKGTGKGLPEPKSPVVESVERFGPAKRAN